MNEETMNVVEPTEAAAPAESMADFEEAINASLKPIHEGDILTGTVIGVSDDELINVMENPNEKNMELAQLLKKYVTWQKGQYLAGKGWGGPNSSKAIFALKQKMGGYQFTDKQEVQQNTDVKINVRFGKVKDAFG